MAKVKEAHRKVRSNTVTTKAKTTTPGRTTNGRVKKVRVNIKKSLKSKNDTSKIDSIESKSKTVAAKTRLCSIKLRRITPDNKSSYNNNSNTLQAQCKVNDKNKNKDSEVKRKSRNGSGEKANNDHEKVDATRRGRKKATQDDEKGNKNDLELLNINTIGMNKSAPKTTVDESPVPTISETAMSLSVNSPQMHCHVILKRTGLIKTKQKDLSDPENITYNVNKRVGPKINDNLAKITARRCAVKLPKTPALQKTKSAVVEPPTPNTTRRCVIKLQKTPDRMKTKDMIETSGPIITKECVIEPPTPNTTRRCITKLRKTPDTIKTKDKIEPSALNITKECVIKLQRTPVSRTENVNKELLESSLTTMLVIDQNKRDNLRKLSLKKSSRKSSENKENETSLNSKVESNSKKNEQQPETAKPTNDSNSETNRLANPLKDQTNVNNRFKLSLKRQNRVNNKSIKNLEVTHFDPQQNSTICFEPVRNSTLLEFGFTNDKPTEKPNEKPKETTPSKDKSSSQNLANKSEEIENLLNSLDEEDEMLLKSPDKTNEKDVINQAKQQKNYKPQNNISHFNNKTNKFFHRSKTNIEENIPKTQAEPNKKTLPKTQQGAKKRRFLTKRSTIVKRDNIYEFLSQSQTSDSDGLPKHADPTADIIKKLIAQGKVRVATNCKGKGKPKFKRKRPPKQMKKIKQAADKKLKQFQKNNKKTTATRDLKNKGDDDLHDEVEVDHFMDDYNDVEPSPDIDNMANTEVGVSQRPNHHNHNKKQANEQQGTFSRLAKTVLINQTGRSDLKRKNASLLLEMVKKYVSTPKNKKTPTAKADLGTDLSPIAMAPLIPSPKPSPWRVDEDAYLPRTFNFSRSSGNLPSFSSDFIPSTPRKEKTNVNIQQQTAINCIRSPIIGNQNVVISVPTIPNIQPLNVNEPSVISSFSLNDSNAENMPPPRSTDENYHKNDMKQLPNPRKALNFRSPLKAINILEVVQLPPYKTPDSNQKSAEKSIQMFGFEENLADESLQDQSVSINIVSHQQDAMKNTKNHPKEDLFGFEDFLSLTEFSSQEHEETNNDDTTTDAPNPTIHDKLQDLGKLKPDDNEPQISLLREKNINPQKNIPLFDDGTSNDNGMRQRGIKEMLCSTMINPQPSTSKEALRQLERRNLKDAKKPNFGEELDCSELFKDPEPETTFNLNEAHRTYIRPYKRKRRLKQNNYVIFLDSDNSDDEQHSAEQKKHQHSHETDTSSEQSPKKKRQRKEPKEKPELAEFVEEFNEMCKEVDSYELIVERSA